LRHETVAQCFRGHACLVRDEENGSTAHGGGVLIKLVDESAVFHRARSVASAKRWSRSSGAPLDAYVIPFEQLALRDVETVGGKNASLGEMIGSLTRLGVQVPGGFATTAHAYREFLEQDGLDARISSELAALDVDDVARLAATGARIRQWILATPFPPALTAAVSAQLQRLSAGGDLAVAVRSSATAEDLPEASFAGQQESFLNVRGQAAVLKA